jgi:hypothetical protein
MNAFAQGKRARTSSCTRPLVIRASSVPPRWRWRDRPQPRDGAGCWDRAARYAHAPNRPVLAGLPAIRCAVSERQEAARHFNVLGWQIRIGRPFFGTVDGQSNVGFGRGVTAVRWPLWTVGRECVLGTGLEILSRPSLPLPDYLRRSQKVGALPAYPALLVCLNPASCYPVR